MLTDIAEVTRLNKALFAFEEQFGQEYYLDWPETQYAQDYFKKSIEDKDHSCFIAEVEGKAVGYVIVSSVTNLYRAVNPICEIDNMYVEEAYRRHGVGKLLMQCVKDWAKEHNAKRIRVGAFTQNENALAFYESNGFGAANTYLEIKL